MKTIMELITEYIENAKIGYPIFTSDIHDYVLNEIEDAKPLVINEYINRYGKKHTDFIRYKKGIYYKCVDTVFGKTKIKQGGRHAKEDNRYGGRRGTGIYFL